MRHQAWKWHVVVLLALACGCATQKKVAYRPAPLTAAEREEIQIRVFEGDFDTAYSATIAVLQDKEWDLEEINKESGVIQAVTKKREDKLGPSEDWKRGKPRKHRKGGRKKDEVLNKWTRWEKLTCHIEPWGGGKVRQRITIAKYGMLPAVTYSYSVGSFGNRKVVNVNAPAKEERVIDEDPLVYGRLYNYIEKALAARRDLK